MKTKNYILIILLIAGLKLSAQDMRQNSYYSLFSDQKANRIGDAVTIIVVESSQASNNAKTSAGRSSEISASGSFSGLKSGSSTSVDAGVGTKNQFDGAGSTQTTGLIKTKISATIDSVMDNGNLFIKGSRKITINGEEQVITIKGIVRSSDIMSDNSVMSYNISEAEISFKGDGIISDVQKPGLLSKLFHWLF